MSYRHGLTVIMVFAIVAIGCGLYGYFAPLTGVTGVWGPLAARLRRAVHPAWRRTDGARRSRGARVVLMLLLALGIVLTAFAAWLLHQWVMLAALGLCAVGWLAAVSGPEGDVA